MKKKNMSCLSVLGLTALLSAGVYNYGRNDVAREIEDGLRNPLSVRVDFNSEATNNRGHLIYTEGVQDCGVCVFFDKDGDIGMTHHGFGRISQIGKPQDLGYIRDTIELMGGLRGIEYAVIVGGDRRYVESEIRYVESLGVRVLRESIDGTTADGAYDEKNTKQVVAFPSGRVYIKKGKEIEKIN